RRWLAALIIVLSFGTLSIGTAALLAFYWLVREEDIFTRMAWSDYRPGEQPNHVLVWHHKNRKSAKIPLPLLDVDGTELWPEMTPRLDGMTRTGTLIVMRDNPDPRKKVHLPWMTGGRNPMLERRMLKGRGSPSRAKANNNTAETRKRGAR